MLYYCRAKETRMANYPRLMSVALLLFITCSLSILQFSLANGPRSVQQRRLRANFLFPADTPPGVNTCPVSQENCGSECNRRCSATSHLNNCLMFCNLCCNKCLCVPPGTYGNKECCACYDNWKTQEGGPKCP